MTNGTILITCRQMQTTLPLHLERLRATGFEVLAPELGARQQFTAAELLASAENIVGIIAGDDELNRRFFEGSAPHLKSVVRWGVGMDSVDVAAAVAAGVSVRNTPGVFGREVADAALAYLLALARGTSFVDREVRAGKWPKYEGTTLSGAVAGVIGLGNIGREVAKRLLAFGSEIVGFDPHASDGPEGVRLVDLDELARVSKFVILCCPLTDETYHLVDARFLALMREDGFLVNVARGPVVDETALEDALSEKMILGAALDVFEVEPLPSRSRLRELPNVVLGSHNGSNTTQGVERASARAVDILLEELGK